MVKESIENTWQKESQLEFRGWGKCQSSSIGIRIKVEDSGPRVKQFGRHINKIPEGMILNFVFDNWKPRKDVKERIDDYIVAIAVHEFGHALGFAHEQNRPNKPDLCSQVKDQNQPNQEILTEYDFESVMNYCNPKYANWGVLSELDIVSVQKKYGAPE